MAAILRCFAAAMAVALVVVPGAAQRIPMGRLPAEARCLGAPNATTACIGCRGVVTVDSEEGDNCQEDDDLNRRTCSELEPVVESIATGETRVPGGECIEIQIIPRGEPYVVQARENRVLDSLIIFRGIIGAEDEPPVVTIIADQGGGGGDDSNYAIRFSSELVVISSIKFLGSPGSITFDDVDAVIIENSAFRFFTKGAVDAYNCETVLVSGSNFSHNVITNVTKAQAYRGHSAGLSIAYTRPDDTYVRVSNTLFMNNSVITDPVGTTVDTDTSGFEEIEVPTLGEDYYDDDNNENSNSNDNDNDNNNNNGNGNKKPPNSLQTVSERFETRGQLFGEQILVGRGGGMALIVSSDAAANVQVSDCLFLENASLEYGGGLYVLLEGVTSHRMVIRDNRFLSNRCLSSGGGIHITFLTTLVDRDSNVIALENNLFYQNSARFGGGTFFQALTLVLYTYDNIEIGVSVSFRSCNYTENSAQEAGGALGVGFHLPSASQQQVQPVEIRDCDFESNVVAGSGIVSIANYPASFRGTNTFTLNTGASVSVIGALVKVHDTLYFDSNSNTQLDGGALTIVSLGQIEFSQGVSMTFSNNTGLLGGAIVVLNPHVSSSLLRLAHNPLCAFLYQDRTLAPVEWADRNVSVVVQFNSAVVSAGVNTNNIDLCSWESSAAPFFDQDNVFRWDFMAYDENYNSAHNNTDVRFAVQTKPISVRVGNDTGTTVGNAEVTAYAGENIKLAIFADDEYGLPTSAVVGFLDDSTESLTGATQEYQYSFVPSSASLNRVDPSYRVDVMFRVLTSTELPPKENIIVRTVGGTDTLSNPEGNFTVIPEICPPGRILKEIAGTNFSACECDNEGRLVVGCEGNIVFLDELLWGYSILRNDTDVSGLTAFPFHTFPCPSKYCRCELSPFTNVCLFTSENQCQCNRTGVLCGDCPEGSGFSALLDICVSCDDYSLFLLVGLILVDVVIFVLLLVITSPVLTWLYPTVFYLQILPHLTKHFPVTFENLSPLMFYVASILGLYFPYDFCLHSNLSAVPVYALRYTPALVAVIVAPIVLAIRLKKFRPVDWHGLWCLVLLLYTPLIHTSMTFLDCPILYDDEPWTSRWYVNANIKCFLDPAHIPMGLFAIFVLCCCVALIPFVVLVATKKLTRPYWTHCLVTPLTCAYKEKYNWWCGVELGKRVVLVLFAVAFKSNDYAVMFTLMVLLTVIGFVKPYKDMPVTMLDMGLLVNILIMLSVRNTVQLKDNLESIHSPGASLLQNSNCGGAEGYNTFTMLLAIFFYVPTLLAVVALVVWGTSRVYHWVKDSEGLNLRRSRKERIDTYEMSEVVDVNRSRALTQTVVELSACDSSSVCENGEYQEQKVSFEVHESKWTAMSQGLVRSFSRQRKSQSKPKPRPKEVALRATEGDALCGKTSTLDTPDTPGSDSPVTGSTIVRDTRSTITSDTSDTYATDIKDSCL